MRVQYLCDLRLVVLASIDEIMTKTIYFLAFVDMLSLAAFLPIAGVHVLSLGGTQLTVGLLASLHSFLQLGFGPVIGSWSDTKGRKPMLIATAIGLLLSNALLGIQSLHIYFLSRVLFGCSAHVQILLRALVTDYHAPEDHVSVFGKMGALAALSFVVGPVLSGHVLEMDNGFMYLVAILTSLNTVSLGIFLMMPATSISKKDGQLQETSPLAKLKSVDWKNFADVFALKFLVESTCSMFFQSFGLALADVYKTPGTQLGYIIALLGVSMIAMNVLVGKIKTAFYQTDHDHKKRNLHGILGLMATFGTLYFLPSFWMYVGVMIPFAVFKILLDTTWMEAVVGRTTENDKGTVMGAFESMMQLAGLGSPLISGFISTYYGYSATTAASLVPLTVAAVLVFAPRMKSNKQN